MRNIIVILFAIIFCTQNCQQTQIPKAALQNVCTYFINHLLPVLKKDMNQLEKKLKKLQGGSVKNELMAIPRLLDIFAETYETFSKDFGYIIKNSHALQNGSDASKDINIEDKYVHLFFHTIAKAKVTAGHIAGLIEGLKMNVNMIITYYKRTGTTSKGNLILPSKTAANLLQYILTISKLNGKLASEFGKAVVAAKNMQKNQPKSEPNSATASLVIGIFEDIGEYLATILSNIEKRVKAIADNTIIRPKNNTQDYLNLNRLLLEAYKMFGTFVKVYKSLVGTFVGLQEIVPMISTLS